MSLSILLNKMDEDIELDNLGDRPWRQEKKQIPIGGTKVL